MTERDEAIIEDMERQIAEGKELEGYVPIKGRISKNLSVTFAIRLSREEMELFSAAAQTRGTSLADLMRNATRAAIAGDLNVERAMAQAAVLEKVRELAQAYDALSTIGYAQRTPDGWQFIRKEVTPAP